MVDTCHQQEIIYMCVTCVLHGAIVQILHFCKHSTTFEQYVDMRGYTWMYVNFRLALA